MENEHKHPMIIRLKEYIDRRDISQAELSRILNLQTSTISNYMNGRGMPALDKLEFLFINDPDLNPLWLLMGIGSMFHSEEERKPLIDYSELEKRIKIIENRIERLERKVHIKLG